MKSLNIIDNDWKLCRLCVYFLMEKKHETTTDEM